MTDKPILTLKQKRKTLSAKKIKKKPIKPILITPYNAQYRPIVTTEESEQITNILTTLPRLIAEKIVIPWSMIKGIPKEERKAFRQHKQKQPLLSNEDIKKGVTLGINSVTEGMEHKILDAVLLSHDIVPFHMVQHILDLSVITNISVLIVQELRKTLYHTLGIASTCIGISVKNNCSSTLESLLSLIQSIHVNYEPPFSHSFKLKGDECNQADNCHISTQKIGITASTSKVSKSIMSIDTRDDSKKCKHAEQTCKNFLLLRTHSKVRVFVPKRDQNGKNQFNADYIQFISSKPLFSKQHIDIQVARMKANEMKIKKKVKQMQQQKRRGIKLRPNKFKKSTNKVKKKKFHTSEQ